MWFDLVLREHGHHRARQLSNEIRCALPFSREIEPHSPAKVLDIDEIFHEPLDHAMRIRAASENALRVSNSQHW